MRRRCAHSMGHGGDVATLPHSRTARPSPLCNLNRRRPVKECARVSGAGCRPGSGSQHVSGKETNHERRKDSTWLPAPFRAANSGGTGHEYDQEVLDRLTRVVRCRDSGERTGSRAEQQQKPNILFIMGDDIGWMQPSIYHRGLMVGETPNIDRIGNEGAIFMDFLAM